MPVALVTGVPSTESTMSPRRVPAVAAGLPGITEATCMPVRDPTLEASSGLRVIWAPATPSHAQRCSANAVYGSQGVQILADHGRQADNESARDDGMADRDLIEMRQVTEQHQVVEI